jgi:FtsP/CotA-like multicopper oxidase with cupredoxin domain
MLQPASIVSRRRVLAGAGAAVTCISLRSGAEEALSPDGFQPLRASAANVPRGPDGAAATSLWGFQGAVPGPLLRIKRGQELRVRLLNALPEPSAIHWHGVRVPNLMDGAPGLTQAAVAPGARFDYRFRPPDAGTFWYHAPWFVASAATSEAAEQAGRRRLYGVLIVDEAEPVDIDREHVLVFDDWQIAPEDGSERIPPNPPQSRPFQIMANGTSGLDLAVRTNERLRLRLVNAAKARVATLRFDRHVVNVMAIDGQPSEPFQARDNRVVLGPGNTADLFIDATLEPGAVAAILSAEASGETPFARLVYEAAAPKRPAPPASLRRLPANPLPARLDLVHAVKLDWPIQELSRGTAPHEQPARFRVKRGRAVTLAIVNHKEFACAVHVHGHPFRLLDRLDDGWKPFWLATVLVGAKQTARIAFLADNPGKWLIECAGIEQAQSVMAGWFEVA